MKPRIWADRACLILFLLSAFLCVRSQNRYDVGVFNDDADYILAAKHLSSPQVWPLGLLDMEGLRHRLPGWPLAIMPWVRHMESSYQVLRILPLCLFLLSIGLYGVLLRRLTTPAFQVALFALYALNPSLIHYSGLVMSEMLFITQVLGVLVLAPYLYKNSTPGTVWGVSVLLAWAALTRVEGIALVLAISAVPLWRRQWGLAVKLSGLSLLALSCYFGANLMLRHGLGQYANVWWDVLQMSSMRSFLFWFDHTYGMLRVLILDNLLAWPWALPPALARGLTGAGALVGVIAMLRGWRILKAGTPDHQIVGHSIGLFILVYSAIHLVCAFTDARYFFVLIPLLWIGMAKAMEKSASPYVRLGGMIGIGSVLLFYLTQYGMAWKVDASRLSSSRLPLQTFEQFRRQTPPAGRIGTWISAPMVTLYTGRTAVHVTPLSDPDLFYCQTQQSGVDYLFYEPRRVDLEKVMNAEPLENAWDNLPTMLEHDPSRFRMVLAVPEERTRVYQIERRPEFLDACALYGAAMKDAERGEFEPALRKLQAAVRRAPTITIAMNAYGATSFLSGLSMREGERMLLKALSQRPDYGVARANLERLRARIRKNSVQKAPWSGK